MRCAARRRPLILFASGGAGINLRVRQDGSVALEALGGFGSSVGIVTAVEGRDAAHERSAKGAAWKGRRGLEGAPRRGGAASVKFLFQCMWVFQEEDC